MRVHGGRDGMARRGGGGSLAVKAGDGADDRCLRCGRGLCQQRHLGALRCVPGDSTAVARCDAGRQVGHPARGGGDDPAQRYRGPAAPWGKARVRHWHRDARRRRGHAWAGLLAGGGPVTARADAGREDTAAPEVMVGPPVMAGPEVTTGPAVTTDSGIPVAAVYTAQDVAGGPESLAKRLGLPGEPPFTRGPYASMYRGQLWTMRQFAGFGSPEETNARFGFLLSRGQTALSVAFDLPTQLGYDSDHEMARAEVGRVGVAIDTADDMADLFAGLPLGPISVNFTINATPPVSLPMNLVPALPQRTP